MNVDLRTERRNRGLTLGDVAKATGLSISALSMIEREERTPHPPAAFAIASFYGYRVADIWPLDDEPVAA